MDAKKVLRSMLVYAPKVQDFRFHAEAKVLAALRRPFRPEYAGLRMLADASPLVLDIGCNRGISIATILSMKPDARVVGFEANPDVAASTRAQFAADRRVEIVAVGLDDHAAERTLHVPVYRGYRFDGLGSFDEAWARALFDGRLLYWFDERRLVVEAKPVSVRPLDAFDFEPTVVKLYVQNHELAVLRGAARTIARSEPIVLAPSRHGDIDALLRSHGYGRWQWQDGRFVAEADGGYVVYYMTPRRARRHRRALSSRASVNVRSSIIASCFRTKSTTAARLGNWRCSTRRARPCRACRKDSSTSAAG